MCIRDRFSGELDEIPPAIEVDNPVACTLVAVFLDDLQRHVQQADGRGRFGLLAPDVYPCLLYTSRCV